MQNLANGLCIRILRSCFDMGSVFGEKTLIYLFYSLSLFIAKIFCLFVSLIAKKCEHNVDKRITNRSLRLLHVL